jgi:transketolase
MSPEALQQLAAKIRRAAVMMVARARASHLGGALSMADLLAVLYGEILRVRPEQPDWPGRDRFLLSKGHSCVALYATLAQSGFFPESELETYGADGSKLMAHVSHQVPGVELSTGSLGHGLPIGCGKALAAKRRGQLWRVFVMLSDGELDEGSNWEAILFAPQHRLDNLIAVVDYNKIQSLGTVAEVLELGPLGEKFRSFRWSVREVDGHNHAEIREALASVPWESGRPSCLIAHTVKGKGVDFMQDKLAWHYQSPDATELEAALQQLGCLS